MVVQRDQLTSPTLDKSHLADPARLWAKAAARIRSSFQWLNSSSETRFFRNTTSCIAYCTYTRSHVGILRAQVLVRFTTFNTRAGARVKICQIPGRVLAVIAGPRTQIVIAEGRNEH